MELDKAGNNSLEILINQGAEAVYETLFLGKRAIVKERFSKKYQHSSLHSELTLKRLNVIFLDRSDISVRYFTYQFI